jgi:hypothetical protein
MKKSFVTYIFISYPDSPGAGLAPLGIRPGAASRPGILKINRVDDIIHAGTKGN